MNIEQELLKLFRGKVAFISSNRFILTGLLANHIAHVLSNRKKNRIEILDRWSLDYYTLFRFLKSLNIDTDNLAIIEGFRYIYAPWKEIIPLRKNLRNVTGVYTNSGSAMLFSYGFTVYDVKNIGKDLYAIIDTNTRTRIYIKLDGYRLTVSNIRTKLNIALDKLYEAYTLYGSIKFGDGVRILISEIGMDRKEANKILRDLISMGLINVAKGGYLEFL